MEKKAYIMRNQMEARLSSIRTSSMRLNDVPEGEGIFERNGLTYEGTWTKGTEFVGTVTSDKYVYQADARW